MKSLALTMRQNLFGLKFQAILLLFAVMVPIDFNAAESAPPTLTMLADQAMTNKPDSLGELKRHAQAGSAEAQFYLGALYYLGAGVKKDDDEAKNWFRKAAQAGLIDAEYGLAFFDLNLPSDELKKPGYVNWFCKANKDGVSALENSQTLGNDLPQAAKQFVNQVLTELHKAHPKVKFRLGYKSHDADLPKAVKALHVQVDKNDHTAEYDLARIFEANILALNDRNVIITLFMRSAEGGYAPAQNRLGELLINSNWVSHDPAQAADWFQKAAIQNYPPGQTNLGMAYLQGQGVAKDEKLGRDWLEKAAQKEDVNALIQLGLLAYDGNANPKDKESAFGFFARAARVNGDLAPLYLYDLSKQIERQKQSQLLSVLHQLPPPAHGPYECPLTTTLFKKGGVMELAPCNCTNEERQNHEYALQD